MLVHATDEAKLVKEEVVQQAEQLEDRPAQLAAGGRVLAAAESPQVVSDLALGGANVVEDAAKLKERTEEARVADAARLKEDRVDVLREAVARGEDVPAEVVLQRRWAAAKLKTRLSRKDWSPPQRSESMRYTCASSISFALTRNMLKIWWRELPELLLLEVP